MKKFLPLFLLATALLPFVVLEPAPVDLVIGFLLLAGVYWIITQRKLPFLWQKEDWLVVAFAFINVLTILWAPEKSLAMSFALKTLYLVGFYFIVKSLISSINKIAPVFTALQIGGLITILIIWLGYFLLAFNVQSPFLWNGTIRAVALFKDPNVLGAFLVPLIIILAPAFLKKNPAKPIIWLVALYLGSGLIFTFSRGAWVNFGLAFLFFISLAFFFLPKKDLWKGAVFFLIAVIIVPASFVLNSWYKNIPGIRSLYWSNLPEPAPISSIADIKDRFIASTQPRVLSGAQPSSVVARFVRKGGSNRLATWKTGLQVILVRPWGVGPGNFESAVLAKNPNLTTPSAHNTYLRVAVEQGLLGILFLGLFLGLLLLKLLKFIRIPHGPPSLRITGVIVLASIMGILAHSLIIDTLHWRHFWLLLGLASVLPSLYSSHSYGQD